MAELTDTQINQVLAPYSSFRGCYPSDRLPTVESLPSDSAIIVNIDKSGQPGSHWCVILHLANKEQPPAWYDPYGLGPDQISAIIGVPTNFSAYLQHAAEAFGHKTFITSRVDCQCVVRVGKFHGQPDVDCGRWCILAVKYNSIPTDLNGLVRPAWQEIFSYKTQCYTHTAILHRVAGV
jgi:hypothetical protein